MNDLDALINMDPLALSKDDAALEKIIQYYIRIRGNIEEGGKNTSKATVDGKAALRDLGIITAPKITRRNI